MALEKEPLRTSARTFLDTMDLLGINTHKNLIGFIENWRINSILFPQDCEIYKMPMMLTFAPNETPDLKFSLFEKLLGMPSYGITYLSPSKNPLSFIIDPYFSRSKLFISSQEKIPTYQHTNGAIGDILNIKSFPNISLDNLRQELYGIVGYERFKRY